MVALAAVGSIASAPANVVWLNPAGARGEAPGRARAGEAIAAAEDGRRRVAGRDFAASLNHALERRPVQKPRLADEDPILFSSPFVAQLLGQEEAPAESPTDRAQGRTHYAARGEPFLSFIATGPPLDLRV